MSSLLISANGDHRIMRLWLDTGGASIRLTIKDEISTSFKVDLVKDVWRHVCLSYQSDFGAWALYVDSRLVACETAQSVSIIINY